MATRYMDWADWAGDYSTQAEAELKRERAESFDLSCAVIVGYTLIPDNCAHAEVDNQGVCEDCGDEVEGWEPDERQLDQHNGTGVAA